ncbi:carboxylesterase/lipase family protein [Nocardiopsis aegyptia]|uniref:Carboxylic ester hydrolase n=1 Tax=Nocardiopsis aegyptia TaxID=220378 RepID=A0A7Z0JD17_9ACTN|nr:carboxylesterase family protein [Nocardiopsis aegyptia]NYJ37009.1 para-nitrobenzyl esterase [Nocardiopsis aegyptia]
MGTEEPKPRLAGVLRGLQPLRRRLPLPALAVVAGVLLWLNQSPWWGWALIAVLLAALAATARWWLRGHWLLRTAAWLLVGVLVSATAVAAYPAPQNRLAGGRDRVPTELVDTGEGPVRGVLDDHGTVEVFAGIPYARPPEGGLRWRAPQPPPPRTEVFEADRFSDVPVQSESAFTTRALAQVVDVPLEGTLLNPYPVAEDSLTLNIWRAAERGAEPLPVLVYIPGGGFTTGSGALPLYDGAALASRGEVITVTLNYRLGVLGFLAHPDLAGESGGEASGNYGIQDQIAALEWIRDNIAAFGGDPDQVTVAGESAGGESVCLLGATPLAEDLMDGLIGSSGACMGTTGDTEDGDQFDTRETATDAGLRLSEELGGATLEEMRAMPLNRILDAAEPLAGHWRPFVDGHVLSTAPADVYASGDQLDVPLLVGSNADEASLALALPPDTDVDEYRASVQEEHGEDAQRFLELYPGETEEQVLDSLLQARTDKVMTRAMHRWARLQTRSGASDAFLYFFSHVPPDEDLEKYGAYHGAEVPYAYDNLGADSDAAYTGTDYRLRDQMSAYWIDFARTGDPNGPGLPAWPTVAREPEQVMEFDGGSAVAPRPRPETVDFWMEFDGPVP